VRFLILSRFIIMRDDAILSKSSSFSATLQLGLISRTLLTLYNLYDITRSSSKHGDGSKERIHFPCESEFRACIYLLQMDDNIFLNESNHANRLIRTDYEHDELFKNSVSVCKLFASNNYYHFFKSIHFIKRVTHACLAHRYVENKTTSLFSISHLHISYISYARVRALTAISKVYAKAEGFPIKTVASLLHFSDENEAIQFWNQVKYIVFHGPLKNLR
jgi:hypothetical protein